jgi:hypothetical protein
MIRIMHELNKILRNFLLTTDQLNQTGVENDWGGNYKFPMNWKSTYKTTKNQILLASDCSQFAYFNFLIWICNFI